ncbi:MAG: hypothetical protein IJL89_06375 [Firmicutes bacterium]|nr:hypothetical protein [Bacillota bacterium]
MNKTKRLFAVLLTTVLTLGVSAPAQYTDNSLLRGFAVTSYAADGELTYCASYWDKSEKKTDFYQCYAPEKTKIFDGKFEFTKGDRVAEEVWYYVDKDMTVNERLYIPNWKTVNLIIKDNSTLTVNGGIDVMRANGEHKNEPAAVFNLYGTWEPTYNLL